MYYFSNSDYLTNPMRYPSLAPLLPLLVLTSCGHTDNTSTSSATTPVTPIVGTWDYTPNNPTGVYVGAYQTTITISIDASGVATGVNKGIPFTYQLTPETTNSWTARVLYSDGSSQTLTFVQQSAISATIIQYHYSSSGDIDGQDSGPATKASSAG